MRTYLSLWMESIHQRKEKSDKIKGHSEAVLINQTENLI